METPGAGAAAGAGDAPDATPLAPDAIEQHAGDGDLFHDALETIQDLANAMLDPFDLSAAEGSVMHASDSDGGSLAGSFSIGNGGSASTGCAGRAAARAAADEPDDADHDYEKFDIGDLGPLLSLRQLRLSAALLSPEAILFRDKFSFVLGLSLTWCMAYWLGWSPSTFYQLYTGLTLLLGLIRWVSYRSKRWHYYMFDFCYGANVLLLVHCWLAPRSVLLSRVTFAFTTGPLSWSILAFRNSLVLHSLDKVTSVYMHIAPALVSWTLRWKPDLPRFGPPEGSANSGDSPPWPGSAGFVDLVLLPIPIYVAWAVAYYLKIFVISAERIRVRGYATLFTYVANTEKKGVYAAIARRVPPPLRPPVYLLLHLLFCCVTMAISIAAWHSFAAHTALIAAICSASMWHGATYYFEFFSRRYLADLERRAAQAAAARADGPRGGGGSAGGGQKPRQRHHHDRDHSQEQQQQQPGASVMNAARPKPD